MEISDLNISGKLITFSIYFCVILASIIFYRIAYGLISPNSEWALVRIDRNNSAALSFGGALVGFITIVTNSMVYSVGLLDFAFFISIGFIGFVAMLFLFKFIFIRDIVARIQEDDVSSGILLCFYNISIGILLAGTLVTI